MGRTLAFVEWQSPTAYGVHLPTRREQVTAKAKIATDVFTFSLGGSTSINGYGLVPAIDDQAIHKARARQTAAPQPERTSLVRQIEDFLARYYSNGCGEAS